jgi:hypothetical protein
VSRQTNTTAELVETMEFLTKSMDTTIYQLEYKINEAKRRLMFMLDFTLMPSK